MMVNNVVKTETNIEVIINIKTTTAAANGELPNINNPQKSKGGANRIGADIARSEGKAEARRERRTLGRTASTCEAPLASKYC